MNASREHQPAPPFFEGPTKKALFTSSNIQAKLTIGQPGDRYEQEADAMADQVVQTLRSPGTLPNVQTKCAACAQEEQMVNKKSLQRQPEEEENPELQTKAIFESNEERPLQRKCAACRQESIRPKRIQMQDGPSASSPDLESRLSAAKGSGSPLPKDTRSSMESAFGADFSGVRVHKDSSSMQMNQELGAQAFTHGSDIYFNKGNYDTQSSGGQRLLAHELTHVVQQGGDRKMVQGYEAGEHAQLGETQAELNTAFAPGSYTVMKGDKLHQIAKKFNITIAELKAANKTKLKKWPAFDGSGRMIEGFNAGEVISIPKKLNEMAKAATADTSAKFTVNGVVLDYGVGIAMGDFFESPEQMAKADPKELNALAVLIRREQSGGKAVTTEEWQKATGGRYLKLAEKNEAHFAPSNAAFVPATAAGRVSANHKTEWRKYHKKAIEAAVAGNKDMALMTNAFADHFLTDAFAAGHLINKRDMMEKFKSQLKLDAKGEEFIQSSKVFFDDVAKDAFIGKVKTEFSKYETVETHYGFHPDIDRTSRFSTLLQGIHKEKPELLANAVAKGTHDKLNTLPGGLPVENNKGDNWNLSGDGTLNAKTREIARRAVAQSQLNIISSYKGNTPANYATMFQKVWDFTPKPSAAGAKQLVSVVEKGTSVKSNELKKAVVKLIKDNYLLIIAELVKLKKLRKA